MSATTTLAPSRLAGHVRGLLGGAALLLVALDVGVATGLRAAAPGQRRDHGEHDQGSLEIHAPSLPSDRSGEPRPSHPPHSPPVASAVEPRVDEITGR